MRNFLNVKKIIVRNKKDVSSWSRMHGWKNILDNAVKVKLIEAVVPNGKMTILTHQCRTPIDLLNKFKK